ncbi:hypothetical protein [Streptomyces sp. NPDC049906]|uniref:hypothetical protein n=1 Tax=Streptomyces sp. NPDC049906 TaxID=3155656 RepID=UPI0034464D9A
MVLARMVVTVLVTWIVLVVMLLAPSALPLRWHYYVYSPASVGLWFLAVLVVPVVVCVLRWPWIRRGRR